MKEDLWIPQAPTPSDLDDHAVPQLSQALQGKRIALLVSGGIAAMKAPLIARELRRHGGEVVAFVSQEALRYTTLDTLAWSTDQPVIERLSARAEHLSDSRPFDVYLLAPATYNTINKTYHGIADGLLTTTLASALGRMARGQSQVMVAPTMHGTMHNPILETALKGLQDMGVKLIPPRDAYGKHNLPEPDVLTRFVIRSLSQSPLKGKSVLVTGGPTPVKIDAIRRLTNRFTGELALNISEALYLKGAQVFLIQGQGGLTPPDYLPHRMVEDFTAYRSQIFEYLEQHPDGFGIFSAAVADYQPLEVAQGKIASGGALQEIKLKPTPKVIQEVRQSFPDLHMVTFKFEEGITYEALMAIAQERLKQGAQMVVANRGEEMQNGHQAHLITAENSQTYRGKPAIAKGIVAYLESQLPETESPEKS